MDTSCLSYPPLNNIEYSAPEMELPDKLSRVIFPDLSRMIWFWFLAVLAAIRFCLLTPIALLLWAHTLLMLKAPIGWDKNILPLFVCLRHQMVAEKPPAK